MMMVDGDCCFGDTYSAFSTLLLFRKCKEVENDRVRFVGAVVLSAFLCCLLFVMSVVLVKVLAAVQVLL